MLPHLPLKAKLTLLFYFVDYFLPTPTPISSFEFKGEVTLANNNGNRAYFEAHREELLEQYPGHWVVIYQRHIVGAASNLDQLSALLDHLQDTGISISEVLVEYLNP
jgi:Family of unknown function (DUF5678)